MLATDFTYSVSDVVSFAVCEFSTLRRFGRRWGWDDSDQPPVSATVQMIGALGETVEAAYRDTLGTGLRDLASVPACTGPEELRPLLDEATPLYQLSLVDGRMRGRIDFLLPQDDGTWLLQDSKVARSAQPSAALQLGLYWDVLHRWMGERLAPKVEIVLGTGEHVSFDGRALAALARRHRSRVEARLEAFRAAEKPVDWNDDDVQRSGTTDDCLAAAREHDDVQLVAGLSMTHRKRLREVGIRTVADLARATLSAAEGGIGQETLARLKAQAQMQDRQRREWVQARAAGNLADDYFPPVRYEVLDRDALAQMPQASPGDLYFDFEGDPMFDDGRGNWGLEYLFGMVLPGPSPRLPSPLARQCDVPKDGPGGATPHEVFALSAEHGFEFRALWAANRAEERQALVSFFELVRERLAAYPDMHIYHYAPYEITALTRLTRLHGVDEEFFITELLQRGVFVDLYRVVRASLRISQHSYSIKKLEPLYMGEYGRLEDLDNAADSIAQFAEFLAFEQRADLSPEDQERMEDLRRSILTYNEYDCLSTARLHQWMADVAREEGITEAWGPFDRGERPVTEVPEAQGEDAEADVPANVDLGEDKPQQRADRLASALSAAAERMDAQDAQDAQRAGKAKVSVLGDAKDGLTTPETARRMAAILKYYQREQSSTWRHLFERLGLPPEDWTIDRTTAVLAGPLEVLPRADGAEWSKETPRSAMSRDVTVLCELGQGHAFTPGASVLGICPRAGWNEELPTVAVDETLPFVAHNRWSITEVASQPDGLTRLVLQEKLPATMGPEAAEGQTAPVGFVQWTSIPTDGLLARLCQSAEDLLAVIDAESGDAEPEDDESRSERRPRARLRHPLTEDFLLHRPPATPLPNSGDRIADIDAALRVPDVRIVAVQGPPGTGKSYTASRVIARLVEDGWRVGVTAQSHTVIRQLLDKLCSGSDPLLPPEVVAKKLKDSERADDALWTGIGKKTTGAAYSSITRWVDARADTSPEGGWVCGATVWGFVGSHAPEVDLLVIDEAAQFPLANALAAAPSAMTMLVVGDPQQLPQVTTAHHPDGAGLSALEHYGAWTEESSVISEDRGYFLAHTYRMNPALTREVSHLSYGGQLVSAPGRESRVIEGVAPGVHRLELSHTGNATASPEEVAAVVDLISGLLGRHYEDEHRPLEARDFCVIAAYNAQVDAVKEALAARGLDGVRTGTVDRFQGSEAPVAIYTTAASTGADAPRGIDFLLNRNRLNVAISRAKAVAYLVTSSRLALSLPSTIEGLEQVAAFVALGAEADERGQETPTAAG